MKKLLRFTKGSLFSLLIIPLLYWDRLTFFHNSTKTYFFYLIAEIALVCLFWIFAQCGKRRPQLGSTGKLFFLYIGILFFTSLLGFDLSYSFWGSFDRMSGLLTWLHLGFTFLLLLSFLHDQKDWSDFFCCSTIIAIFVAFIHLLTLGGTEIAPLAHGGSTLGNSSFFGTYLVMMIFVALFTASQSLSRQKKLFGICSTGFLIFTLFTTNALASQYSFIGGAIFFLALLLIFSPTKWKKIVGFSITTMLLATFLATSLLLFQPNSSIHKKFVELSSESRFTLWNITWEGIKERPILGWGLENFGSMALQYYNPCLGSRACGTDMWFDRAHNKPLDVWIESGLLGLIVYLSIFLSAILEMWQAPKNNIGSLPAQPIIIAAIATYFVQNLTSIDTITSLFFWIVLLAFVNQTRQHDEPSLPIHIAVPITATVLLPICLIFFVFQPLRGNLALAHARIATTIKDRLISCSTASTLSPLGIDMRRTLLGAHTTETFWKIPKDELALAQQYARKELELSKQGLLKSLEHKTNNLKTSIALGLIYQTEAYFFDPSSFQKAEEVLKIAIKNNPNHPQPKWTLAGVFLNQKKIEDALALTQTVLEQSPNVPQAYIYHLIVLKWKDDKTTFEEVATRALNIEPNLIRDIEKIKTVDFKTQEQNILALFH